MTYETDVDMGILGFIEANIEYTVDRGNNIRLSGVWVLLDGQFINILRDFDNIAKEDFIEWIEEEISQPADPMELSKHEKEKENEGE